MLKIVHDNILNASEGFICHQVNCVPVMGSGVARQLADVYPDLEKAYIANTISKKREVGYQLLGQVFKYKLSKSYDAQEQFVMNIYGQWDTSSQDCSTNYMALFKGILYVLEEADLYGENVAMPFKIGCGRA